MSNVVWLLFFGNPAYERELAPVQLKSPEDIPKEIEEFGRQYGFSESTTFTIKRLIIYKKGAEE